jgi:hypothetical protein
MSPDDLARRAAMRLGDEMDRNLPAAVEAQVQGAGPVSERFEPATTIALAALILSAAKFAWDIYRDIKKDSKAAPAREVIARRMRLELNVGEEINSEQSDRVIAVVVDELISHPPMA